MNRTIRKLMVAVALYSSAAAVSAGGSAEQSAQALNHSMQAIGHSLNAGFKLASGAAAIPLMSVGEIGKVSGEMGHEFWEEATTPVSGPLPVSDEIITVDPSPAEQLEEPR